MPEFMPRLCSSLTGAIVFEYFWQRMVCHHLRPSPSLTHGLPWLSGFAHQWWWWREWWRACQMTNMPLDIETIGNQPREEAEFDWIWIIGDLEFGGIIRNQFWSSCSPMDPHSSKFLDFALEIAMTRTYQMIWYSYLSLVWKFMYLSLLFPYDNIHKLVVHTALYMFNNWTLLAYWDYSRIYYTPYLLWIDASSTCIGTIRLTHTVNSCTMSLCVSNIPTNFDYWLTSACHWKQENSGIQLQESIACGMETPLINP